MGINKLLGKTLAPHVDDTPPEGFIDNTVYRYRLLPDGTEELIGTMEAFPEGWEKTKILATNNKKKGEDSMPPARDWTKMDADLIRLREEGKTFKEIGNILGVSPSVAHNRCRELGIKPLVKPKSKTKPKPDNKEEPFKKIIEELHQETENYTFDCVIEGAITRVKSVLEDPVAVAIIKELVEREGI